MSAHNSVTSQQSQQICNAGSGYFNGNIFHQNDNLKSTFPYEPQYGGGQSGMHSECEFDSNDNFDDAAWNVDDLTNLLRNECDDEESFPFEFLNMDNYNHPKSGLMDTIDIKNASYGDGSYDVSYAEVVRFGDKPGKIKRYLDCKTSDWESKSESLSSSFALQFDDFPVLGSRSKKGKSAVMMTQCNNDLLESPKGNCEVIQNDNETKTEESVNAPHSMTLDGMLEQCELQLNAETDENIETTQAMNASHATMPEPFTMAEEPFSYFSWNGKNKQQLFDLKEFKANFNNSYGYRCGNKEQQTQEAAAQQYSLRYASIQTPFRLPDIFQDFRKGHHYIHSDNLNANTKNSNSNSNSLLTSTSTSTSNSNSKSHSRNNVKGEIEVQTQTETMMYTENYEDVIGDFSQLSDEKLFMLFYTKPQDFTQILAQDGLCKRGWFYYKPNQLWLRRQPHVNTIERKGPIEIGFYQCFNCSIWDLVIICLRIDLRFVEDAVCA